MADGGAMFGAIPKRAWQRKYVCDENNLCPLAMRCVLAISDQRTILIDTGMGIANKEKAAYYEPHGLVSVCDAVSAYVEPSLVTDVVLSHSHFDHCGDSTYTDSQGIIQPSFPHASYWLSQKQWQNLHNPNRLERDSIFPKGIISLYNAGILHLIDEQRFDLCEGFELRQYNGHSEGQLVAFVKTKGGVTTFPGDLIPTASHVSLEWISAYDVSAIQSLTEKERFLAEASDQGYELVYYHDVKIVSSKVKRLNDGFIAKDVIRKA